jgi:hypothetical protein
MDVPIVSAADDVSPSESDDACRYCLSSVLFFILIEAVRPTQGKWIGLTVSTLSRSHLNCQVFSASLHLIA